MFKSQKGRFAGQIVGFERFEQVSVSVPPENMTVSSPSFQALAEMVDKVRAQSNVPDEDILLQVSYDSACLRLNLRVDFAEPWNAVKEPTFLDHPVSNGTVVIFKEEALTGNEPMVVAMLARERVEIQLGIRTTHRNYYGRINPDGNVFLPGLGVYRPGAFCVVRLLEKEEDGYFKED